MQKQKEFIELIKKNEGVIFKISFTYANTKEQRKDLYQEIVYQLWKSFGSFKGESKISTWIYRVALNTSITYLKKEKRKENTLQFDKVLQDRIDQVDTIMDERVQLLYQHIKNLSTVEKGIILLYLEGRNYGEISEITGFTSTNVGTRINRIKQKLKSQILK